MVGLLHERPDLEEVNFWRPGGRRFSALSPGEPLLFRLKSPINRIGGFGLFARYASLPVWRAWEVFAQANGTSDEADLLTRLARLARRLVTRADLIGCVAVNGCVFFDQDFWLEVPQSFNPQKPLGFGHRSRRNRRSASVGGLSGTRLRYSPGARLDSGGGRTPTPRAALSSHSAPRARVLPAGGHGSLWRRMRSHR
jgi:hypothetical protein